MRLEDIVKSSLIKNLRQAINPETLTTELPLILKFLYNSTRYLKNPQDEKLLSNLIKKVKEDSKIRSRQIPTFLFSGYFEWHTIYFPLLDNLRLDKNERALKDNKKEFLYWSYQYPFKSIEENADLSLKMIKYTCEILGANKTNLIGHSMGGPIIYYIAMKNPELVNKCIAIGSPFNGTKASNFVYVLLKKPIIKKGVKFLEKLGYKFDPLREMSYGSEFLKSIKLSKGVDYYSIFSENDEVVLPWESAIKEGATNINVNKHLGLKNKGHIKLVYDDAVRQLISGILNNDIDKERFNGVKYEMAA